MRLIKEEREKKVQEIEDIIGKYIKVDSEKKDILSTFLKNGFINITPPEEDEEEFMQFITLDSKFHQNGLSRKPGNIILNIKSLIKSLPDLIAVIHDLSSADSDKYLLAIRLGISIWNTLWKNANIDIDRDSSIVLYVLWTNCDNNHEIQEELAYSRVNDTREGLKVSKLSIEEYTHKIDFLCKIKCLKINNGIIKLIEGVKIQY